MKKGFTLIELLIVLTIVIVTGAVVFSNLGTRKVETDLIVTDQQIGSLLRQAQVDSMDQESDVAWGVHFSNATNTAPFYALFQTSYSTATVVGGLYRLPSTVAFTTSTLARGATLDVIFSSVSGLSSVSTSIGLYMPKENTAFSSTISIASSGSVSY
ncbi:MAG TPA: type II secretion system protein [Candidatus Paceibacterota bacterium]